MVRRTSFPSSASNRIVVISALCLALNGHDRLWLAGHVVGMCHSSPFAPRPTEGLAKLRRMHLCIEQIANGLIRVGSGGAQWAAEPRLRWGQTQPNGSEPPAAELKSA